MPRPRFSFFLFALFFLPLSGFAAVADLEVAARIVGAPHTATPVKLEIVVTNHGPDRANNHTVLEFDHVTTASLGVTLALPPSIDQDRIGTLRITVENRSVWDVTDGRLLVGIAQLGKLLRTDPAMPCTQTTDRFASY